VEQQRWREFCRWRLTANEAQASLTLDEFYTRLQLLMTDANTTEIGHELLKQLATYADKLKQEL
jgi:exodeoxyribonuclease-1